MKLPSLSVVVPNYNHAKYLPNCLAAIANQSVPAKEIIVVDDASTDNSVAVLETLARQYPTLRLYRNEVNLGFMGAVNRGLDFATGDFVTIPAADDQVMPGLFEKSLHLLAEHPQAGLCATICRLRDLQSGLAYNFGVHVCDQPCYLSPQKMLELARQGRLLVFGTTMMWRRDALLRAGKYLAGLKWHCDWFVMFSIGFRHGMCFVPEVLGEFRVESSSVSGRGMRNRDAQREVLRYALELLEEPQNQDIAPFFRRSAILAPFGKEMLWLILTHRRYWKNLNPIYLRQALWWTVRIEAKKVLPHSLARLYYKLSGVVGETRNS
jgi:glycosyltransferase involved in cell wall biosynthesis